MKLRFTRNVFVLAALGFSGTALAQSGSNAELLQRIQQLEAQVKVLTGLVQNQAAAAAAVPPTAPAPVAVPVPAPAMAQASAVRLGGYGELIYNNIENDTTNAQKRQADFRRFVLYAGYDFGNGVRFNSELELEHALAGNGNTPNGSKAKPGEIELEQAFIEIDLPYSQTLKTGLFLLPIGLINETHEPSTFYGVERNPVETQIIPAVWWESGASIGGRIGDTGLSYDFAYHTGLSLPTSGSNAYRIRAGRQKSAEARADSMAYTARLEYLGVPGLRLGLAAQRQLDATQSADNEDVSATLLETHIAYDYKAFSTRALYAHWDLDGAGAKAAGRDEQDGYYLEASYKVLPTLGFFARTAEWDNGGTAVDTAIRQNNFGLSYWLRPSVVFKADYQTQSGADNFDGFNLGMGYNF